MPYSYRPHHFEDLEEGQTFESTGRTITETDVVNYAAIGGDWTELHTNTEYAASENFERRVAHGPLTLTVALGLAYRCGFLERTVQGFLGVDSMRFPEPVFIDDTVTGEFTVREKRTLETTSDSGVARLQFDLTNQDESQVFDSEMKFLVQRRSDD